MKQRKMIGLTLLVLPLLIIIGSIVQYQKLWIAIDCVIFLVAGIAGMILLRQK